MRKEEQECWKLPSLWLFSISVAVLVALLSLSLSLSLSLATSTPPFKASQLVLCWCLCSQIIGSSFNNEGRSALVNWKQANRGVKWRDENCSNSSSNIQTVDYESHDNAILELEKEVKPSNGKSPPAIGNLTTVNFPSCIIALWLQSLICFQIPGIL